MKKPFLIILATILINPLTRADEGMWLLPLLKELNLEIMQEKGLTLEASDIYSEDGLSLKDAIVIFGGGCTGEVISEKGLILTNHHCGYSAIQYHSSVENDYLADGFWAASHNKELNTPNLSVKFLHKIENVTGKITGALSDTLTEEERNKIINMKSNDLEDSLNYDNDFYLTSVKSFFENTQFYLFVYKEYPDVRFVGAPPSSIGKFGADTDNWTWPRHTGDFSLFRVYGDESGNPAKYSEDNVPLKTEAYLPISLKGYDRGDFTMVLGFPGSTIRYITSYNLGKIRDIVNKTRIKVRGVRQEILLADMQASDKVRIQYATKYSRSTNYWKYSIGQNKGIKRLNIIEEKRALENEFLEWVQQESEREKKYGNALEIIEKNVEEQKPYLNAAQYMNESFIRSCEAIDFSYKAKSLYEKLKDDEENYEEMVEYLIDEGKDFYKNYNPPTDKKVTKAMLKLYQEDIPEKFHPEVYETIRKKYRGDIDKFVDKMFDKSVFVDSVEFYEFLEKPRERDLRKDIAFQTALSINETYDSVLNQVQIYNRDINRGQRLFLTGLMEMNPDEKFYPDANFTMRLSYGDIDGYSPRDAVYYEYYTTLKGVMEKEDPDNWEFVVPDKLKDLYQDKDYGEYAENDTMRVCFISDNDITGGNSGSPVINGNGELIGLAFDGNWEAMTGDIDFEPEIQRTISVDVRYILFVIDKFAEARHLIDEMKIVR